MNRFLSSNRKKRRVIVVDDELINRELLETILSMNYEVDCVENGQEAMDVLTASPDVYSLILLDILMPRMSGFQVIEACKADEKLKSIPIIVMTSEKSAEVRSIRLGADDFITKPYRMPEVILARCERIIELSEEKRLIESIEKDKLTGLYTMVFFYAYIQRMIKDLSREMDAVVIRHDSHVSDDVMKKTADLIKDTFVGKKGMACRTDWASFCVCCRHRDNYEELLTQMQAELSAYPPAAGVRLMAGVYPKVDVKLEVEGWFERAAAACGKLVGDNEHHTAVYSE